MKRVLLVLGSILVIGLAVAYFFANSDDARTSTPESPGLDLELPDNEDDESPAAVEDSNLAEAPDQAVPVEESGNVATPNHPAPPLGTRPAIVRRLADGDSFDITWSDTDEPDEIRLFGINAPERDACFGQDARDVLDILIGGDELTVEMIGRDDFGRVLANVWVGGIFINATLVELGAALALSDGGSHASLITDAQERAKTNQSGLWSPDTCGPQVEVDVRIGWIEADAPGRDDENKNGEWIEIVNDGTTDADMSGWSIRDESTRHRYSFPNGFVLGAGDEVRVFSGCGDDRSDELYWCDADPVWNNGGDTGFLVDAAGRFVDSRSY